MRDWNRSCLPTSATFLLLGLLLFGFQSMILHAQDDRFSFHRQSMVEDQIVRRGVRDPGVVVTRGRVVIIAGVIVAGVIIVIIIIIAIIVIVVIVRT